LGVVRFVVNNYMVEVAVQVRRPSHFHPALLSSEHTSSPAAHHKLCVSPLPCHRFSSETTPPHSITPLLSRPVEHLSTSKHLATSYLGPLSQLTQIPSPHWIRALSPCDSPQILDCTSPLEISSIRDSTCLPTADRGWVVAVALATRSNNYELWQDGSDLMLHPRST
jgi:hypothetical protein